ncbi:alpha/beta hydrolase [Emticicia sp. SJ17W-69]|uniref:alpha/beta hydrolase n=1 Tax=Emticicia sp. SJ17W-69 TaxID=3421657 RepID=UPI003EBC24F8
MKVTKQMHNKELQGSYDIMKFSSRLLMNDFGIRMLNANTKRSKGKNIEGLQCEEKYIPSRNGGPDIRIRIFKPLNTNGTLPGMLYIHGGGYMLGSPEEFMPVIKKLIDTKPCVVVAPDYRKAVDAPYPAAFNDCYDTLLWLNENVNQLHILPKKLIVTGHSSGGGLTAAITLKATDTNDVKIAFQMPIYPMLDDRQNTVSAIDNNSAGWNAKSNKLGWSKYVGHLREIPHYAAPARAKNYSKLPPTISFVGDLEPFRDETIEYVKNIEKNGIPVLFKLYPGCYHAFEILFPKLEISKDAWQFLLSSYASFMDKYVYEK